MCDECIGYVEMVCCVLEVLLFGDVDEYMYGLNLVYGLCIFGLVD